MIRTVLARAATRLMDGDRLEGTPQAIELGAAQEPVPLGAYLELDDDRLFMAMRSWESASDPILSDLAKRVRGRRLFKTFELFGEQASISGREEALATARSIAEKNGLDPDYYVGLDAAVDTPFGAEAEPLMVVFQKGPARPLSDVSFLLARLAGQVLSRIRIVVAPELRDEVTKALAG